MILVFPQGHFIHSLEKLGLRQATESYFMEVLVTSGEHSS